jgi:chromate transport protein ChrA
MFEPTVILFDLSMVLIMLILAYLSKRLGDAMKTPSWYLALYGSIVIVILACALDITAGAIAFALPASLTLGLRLGAGMITIGVCIRYWSWLFSEFFGV